MASEQIEASASRIMRPRRGKRPKVKGPPFALPQLPLLAVQHRLDTSSDELEEEKSARQEPKRLRSTSSNPGSETAGAWAPHDYDNVMGIGPVSSPF